VNHICETLHNCENDGHADVVPVDVLVIGGGVNGLAVARESQLRGFSTMVVDGQDFGAGTSGASSRLVHGGIRYLENLEFGLVRESLKERERLLHTAPHLVKPFPLLIPFYRHNRRHPVILSLGMLLYDVLSFDKSTPVHRLFTKRAAEKAYPGLAHDSLSGATLYYDAQAANTERLCIEQAIDLVALGGTALNHTKVTAMAHDGAGLTVSLENTLTGATSTQRAQTVVNAAGPWVDGVLALEKDESPRLIGGSKGSHFTVGPFTGAPATGVHFEAVSDGRAILVLPLPDGNFLIGATDIFYDGNPGDAVMSDPEISYLLAEVNQLIPEAHLTEAHVLHSVSGIRPLPHSPKAKSAAQVSRSHHLVAHPTVPGLFSVTGGKLTTHRALGEMAIDAIEKLQRKASLRASLQRLFAGPTASSRRLKLPGARTASWPAFEAAFLADTTLPAPTARRLLDLYGVRAAAIEGLVRSDATLRAALPGNSRSVAAEVPFVIHTEFARTLTDIVSRRLLLTWDDDAGLDSIEAVAILAAKELGWSSTQTDQELDDYRSWIRLRRPAAYEPA
jgi:glycerol-3-phosphate dehydrogenase